MVFYKRWMDDTHFFSALQQPLDQLWVVYLYSSKINYLVNCRIYYYYYYYHYYNTKLIKYCFHTSAWLPPLSNWYSGSVVGHIFQPPDFKPWCGHV